jgi:hypothetical protein
MKHKLLRTMLALVIATSVAVGFSASPSALGAGTNTFTGFILQNLGSDMAIVNVEYRSTTGGTAVKTDTGITITVGSSANFDQRYQSDLGSPFAGGVIAYSTQPLGAVVNVGRTPIATGAVNAYESYAGYDDTSVGTYLMIPQVVKNISSAGLIYNTSISVQNTDIVNSTAITITYVPDPVTNPLFCKAPSTCISTPYQKTGITIPAGGVYVVDQASQSSGEIGDMFFGGAQISAARNVAVVTLMTGATSGTNLDQTLNAIPAYPSGATGAMALPFLGKYFVSLGDSYSSAYMISNFSSLTATVTVTYTTFAGVQSGVDTVEVGGNSTKNVDLRSTSGLSGAATFFGSARATSDQPVRIMSNMRGGSRYAMTYDAVYGGGTSVYAPVAYKYIPSQGYQFSSSITIANFGGSPAEVYLDYRDARSGKPSALNQGPIVVTDTVSLDLRSSFTTASLTDFYGGIVVRCTNGQSVGAIVQTRGAGGVGDAQMAYRGFSK